MAERRLPFCIKDDDGVERRGELLIARARQRDFEPNASAAFTIVLASEPVSDSPPLPANLVICSPDAPVRVPSAAREAAAAYAGDAPAAVRLPRATLDAYSAGVLLSATPLGVSTREVFSNGATPRLELIARRLIATLRRTEAHWRALAEALALPDKPQRIAGPKRVRALLHDLLDHSNAPDAPYAASAIERLRCIADGAEPASVASSAGALADDVALVRCAIEQPDDAATLNRMRAYLGGASTGSLRELGTDLAVTRERLSFVTLLAEPRQLDGMRAAFEMFRDAYATAYESRHEAHGRALVRLHDTLREAAPVAAALERLNTLRALGRPLGDEALAELADLRRTPAGCSVDALAAALDGQPSCPECGLSMDGATPGREGEQLVRRLEAALARQQARLASEAVRRILARGGERLDRFLEVVQASDLAGVARVLDDDLLAFLQELLVPAAATTPAALELADALARAYPEIDDANIDDAAETLRRLLRERLDRQDGEPLRLADDGP